MNKDEINQYLTNLKNQLLKPNSWKTIKMNRDWAKSIPVKAGVYILIEKDTIVYVGETGNLRGRMTDLLDSRHHTVRRTIGKKYYSKEDGFIMATTKAKFPSHIEDLVNNHICEQYLLSYVEVPLGRKELEELIVEEIEYGKRLNKRKKRQVK